MASDHEEDLIGKAWTKGVKAAEKIGDAAKETADAAAREADRIFTDDDVRKANPPISEARARQIAERRVPGAPIKDVDLETENGVLVWEVNLETGIGREEVLIDAVTGQVLRVRHDH